MAPSVNRAAPAHTRDFFMCGPPRLWPDGKFRMACAKSAGPNTQAKAARFGFCPRSTPPQFFTLWRFYTGRAGTFGDCGDYIHLSGAYRLVRSRVIGRITHPHVADAVRR